MSQFRGVVRWFNNAKGYGFLGRDGGPDVFVHYSAIEKDGYKTLKEGDQVEYNVVAGAQGRPQADHVCCVPRTSLPAARHEDLQSAGTNPRLAA